MRVDQARDPLARLVEKLTVEGACFVWTGLKDKDGYGRIRVGSRTDGSRREIRTHVLSWELSHGSIPYGLGVLHHCDNPPCCNTDHLYLGTPADNGRDVRVRKRNPRSRLTHCKRNHPFEGPESSVRIARNGTRHCNHCSNARRRAARHKE